MCKVCGDTATLDRIDVVAAAEIVVFVEAHCVHDRVSIEFCDPPDLQSPGLTDSATSTHQD
ncbi:MAG TPA: hypothetical protein VKJ07_05550 [Mycobacteriales bacterium]|nr:hypothetical protein [Mycobacteriales bacterium]